MDEIHRQNNLQVVDHGVTTRLAQREFYEFLADPSEVLVFTGETQVETGNGNHQDVKKHHEMVLEGEASPQNFKMDNAEDALFNLSKLRSHYLAESRQRYANENGYAGTSGWYWNPCAPGWDLAWGPGWGWSPGWGLGRTCFVGWTHVPLPPLIG